MAEIQDMNQEQKLIAHRLTEVNPSKINVRLAEDQSSVEISIANEAVAYFAPFEIDQLLDRLDGDGPKHLKDILPVMKLGIAGDMTPKEVGETIQQLADEADE